MKTLRNGFNFVTPYRVLVLGYAIVTVIGAILLYLPISSAQERRQSFVDSLFVATSGISTTGLAPVDIGSCYNRFGQIVLLCIFQIGGVGYMTFITFLAYLLRIRLPITTKFVAKESLPGSNLRILEKFETVATLQSTLLSCFSVFAASAAM